MEVHIYTVKAMSQAGNIWVKDIMMTQNRPKLKENQPGILKIYAFCQIIQQGTSSPEGMLLGLRIFYENAPEKLQPVPTKSFRNSVFQGRSSWGIVVT